jgi:hypothetical protein
VLGPLGFTFARERAFEASMTIFPREVRPYPAIHDLGYYRALLADPELREQTKLNAGVAVGDDDITIRRGPKPEALIVTVRADTPEDAQAFTNALGPQIAGATKRELARVTSQDAGRLRERLRRSGLSVDGRRALRARLRRIEELGTPPPPRVLLGGLAAVPKIDRWPDQLANGLPGDFPARPNPARAALAGLFVAATLWAICRLLIPPGSGLLSIGVWRRASR